jgi:hypothetical protein
MRMQKLIVFLFQVCSRMVIRNVAFAAKIRDGSIKVRVPENYCEIRIGRWKLRLDSVAAHVSEPIDAQFHIRCSLVQSQQIIQNSLLVLADTPLHLFTLVQFGGPLAFPAKVQLLGAGQQTQWYEFCHGSQDFYVTFTEVVGPTPPPPPPPPPPAPAPKPYVPGSQLEGLFVAGVISFEEF